MTTKQSNMVKLLLIINNLYRFLKSRGLFIPCFFFYIISNGQNLVKNPDFEDYNSCPQFMSNIENCIAWNSAIWSCDFFATCAVSPQTVPNNYWGHTYPESGNNYAGFATYSAINQLPSNVGNREWLRGELIDTLNDKISYNLSFFIKKANTTGYSTVLSALITDKYISCYNCGSFVDYDTINFGSEKILTFSENLCDTTWHNYSLSFKAKGGEKYIYFGNFFPDSLSNITLCQNYDSVDYGNALTAYYYIDNVSLVKDTTTSITTEIINGFAIYPNPANLTLTVNINNLPNAQLALFDVSGRRLLQQQVITSSQTVDITTLPAGMYVVVIYNGNTIIKREKVVVVR